MFHKILVPLDGSDLAEQALESAFGLARQFGSEMVLLRVVVPEEIRVSLPALIPPVAAFSPAELSPHAKEAEAYLFGVKIRSSGAGVRMRQRSARSAVSPPSITTAVPVMFRAW